MSDIINDPPRYYNFFKWRSHYTFEDTTDSDHRETVCEFCASLNRQIRNKTIQVYRNIARWWNTNISSPKDDGTMEPEVSMNSSESGSLLSELFDFFFD